MRKKRNSKSILTGYTQNQNFNARSVGKYLHIKEIYKSILGLIQRRSLTSVDIVTMLLPLLLMSMTTKIVIPKPSNNILDKSMI